MAHNHSHEHDHGIANYNRAFALGVALNLGFVVIEATYGILAHSLALLADAGHNLSDVLGLLLAWGASVLVRKQASVRRTYGLRRSSILAALVNAVVLLVAVGAIAWEALYRLTTPSPVAGQTVIWVAALGIVVNLGSAFLFMAGQKDDLNIRGAFLHLLGDAAVSLGTVVAGVLLLATGWLWIDPVVSLAVSLFIVLSTWELFTESLDLVLDAVPEQIDPEQVRTYLEKLPGVIEVHDLHIWAMSTTETALTAHLLIPDGHPGNAFLAQVNHQLHHQFHIEHTTLQVEIGTLSNSCILACDNHT